MATDYDAPRTPVEESRDESLEALKAQRNTERNSKVDVDETVADEEFELPGADLSNEELTIEVVPQRTDEFVCTSCFLVQHHTQASAPGSTLCRDCA